MDPLSDITWIFVVAYVMLVSYFPLDIFSELGKRPSNLLLVEWRILRFLVRLPESLNITFLALLAYLPPAFYATHIDAGCDLEATGKYADVIFVSIVQ